MSDCQEKPDGTEKEKECEKIKTCGNYCFVLIDNTLKHFICKNTKDKNDENESNELELCKEIEIIGKKSFAGDKTVAVVAYSKKLKTVEQSAFENCKKLEILECKENATAGDSFTIQYRAFKNCESLHTVILPKIPSSKKLIIESEAFYGCKALRTVVMITGEDGVLDISPDAFEMCDSDLLTFVVSAGSSAERFAREKGYRYVSV